MNTITIFLGIAVGSKAKGEIFLSIETLEIQKRYAVGKNNTDDERNYYREQNLFYFADLAERFHSYSPLLFGRKRAH